MGSHAPRATADHNAKHDHDEHNLQRPFCIFLHYIIKRGLWTREHFLLHVKINKHDCYMCASMRHGQDEAYIKATYSRAIKAQHPQCGSPNLRHHLRSDDCQVGTAYLTYYKKGHSKWRCAELRQDGRGGVQWYQRRTANIHVHSIARLSGLGQCRPENKPTNNTGNTRHRKQPL